eukprot:scaffold26550_cov122-Cylindrotheca_fusiformis.AAC.2
MENTKQGKRPSPEFNTSFFLGEALEAICERPAVQLERLCSMCYGRPRVDYQLSKERKQERATVKKNV